MITVIWHPSAEHDLAEIVDYIALDNMEAAQSLARYIVNSTHESLTDSPHVGRPGRVEGTRELVVHKNYIVIYEVMSEVVNVLNIVHAARLYP